MDAFTLNRTDWRLLAAIAALHGLAAFALFGRNPAIPAMGPRPLIVSLIEPAPPASVQAVESPRPMQRRAPMDAEQSPVLAAPADPSVAMAAIVPQKTAELTTKPAAAPATEAAAPARFDADYLNNPAPAYPSLSRRLREQGRVLLRVYVEPDGTTARVEIKSSSGFERLDSAALNAVREWRFVPARQGSTAVGAWIVVPIAFSLRS
ncbi:MAG: energy transducer TonB [Betaproteobacteria bacterium]|nr:energy transducer TonB [Betaproteobacteria bacterium]